MKRKVIPIKKIIKKVERLSNNPDTNKTLLNKYSKLVKTQKDTFSKISINKIKNKLNSSDLTMEEYCKYRDLLTEKKNYAKYDSVINNIINKDYDAIYLKREFKRKKIAAVVVTGSLLAILGGFYLKNNKNKKDDSIKKQIITEATTEDSDKIEFTTEDKYEKDKDDLNEPINDDIITENTTEVITTEVTTEYAYKADNTEKYTTQATTQEYTTENTTQATTQEYTTENTTQATTQEYTTENTTQEYTTEDGGEIEFDDGVIDYSKFSKLKDFYFTASSYIDTMENTMTDKEKRDEAKENAKEKVVQYIDFIFYGNEINGVTFDELKEDEKEKVYEQLQSLNESISEKDPDYLSNMSERYSRLKDLGSLTLNNAKEKVREKVGDDYYNDAGQVKDDTVDTIKDTGSLIKKFIKEKYEEWRDN